MARLRFLCPILVASCALAFGQSPKAMYQNDCAVCHGKDGRGASGPDLHKPLKHGADVKAVENTILYGIPGTLMPGFTTIPGPKRHALAEYVVRMNRETARAARR